MTDQQTEGRDTDDAALGDRLMATKASAAFPVSRELLADYDGFTDLLGKALRGEITIKPPPKPRYHRCIACWLLSKLPGHSRCEHGRMESCIACYNDDY